MKTLKNHVIIYDAECPMCDLYTRTFVKSGMLPSNGRVPYTHLNDEAFINLDKKRACNEIALVDRHTHQITYGINSLFKIFSNSFPVAKPLLENNIVVKVMAKVYSFISYNRKVIMPAAKTEEEACMPDFSLKYRIAYISFAVFFTSAILSKYAQLLQPILPVADFSRELFVSIGQILFQATILRFTSKKLIMEYLGNLMTVSLGGAILLLPVILVFNFFSYANPTTCLLYFLVIVSLMFIEHTRRARILRLSPALSVSWVAYRFLVAILIFWLS